MILKKILSFLTQEILMKSLNFQLKTYLLLRTLMKVVFLYFQFLFFYFEPRTVSTISGASGSRSIFARRRWTCTLTNRVSAACR